MITETTDYRYEIMSLTEPELRKELLGWSREALISWLSWNDPNGIYRDEESIAELGNIMTREEGIDLIISQIIQGS